MYSDEESLCFLDSISKNSRKYVSYYVLSNQNLISSSLKYIISLEVFGLSMIMQIFIVFFVPHCYYTIYIISFAIFFENFRYNLRNNVVNSKEYFLKGYMLYWSISFLNHKKLLTANQSQQSHLFYTICVEKQIGAKSLENIKLYQRINTV